LSLEAVEAGRVKLVHIHYVGTWSARRICARFLTSAHYDWYIGKVDVGRVIEVKPQVGVQRDGILGFVA
jgi:hypothetical protein